MQIIRFAINTPQELRLTSLEGRLVDSKFGGSQYLFYAQEGVFYVSEAVGRILMDQFRALDVKPGELVEICKSEVGNGTGRKTQWIVSVVVGDGFATISEQKVAPPQPATELERKLADSIAVVEARKQAQRAPVATTAVGEFSARLVLETNALVDSYAAALKTASEKHGNAVKPEDVRALLVTAYINASKQAQGGRNAA